MASYPPVLPEPVACSVTLCTAPSFKTFPEAAHTCLGNRSLWGGARTEKPDARVRVPAPMCFSEPQFPPLHHANVNIPPIVLGRKRETAAQALSKGLGRMRGPHTIHSAAAGTAGHPVPRAPQLEPRLPTAAKVVL